MTFKEFVMRAKRADKKNMIYAGLCVVGCIAALVFTFFF